ncbi:MAG: DMT family transporter [Duodenibacillus sp.]
MLITALIWGFGFVAQALGMEHVSPFTFTWARSLIGGLFLLSLMPFFDRLRAREAKANDNASFSSPWKNRTLWVGGIACGTVLFISESLQQFGLLYTTVGKASFLTGLYIIIVPIVGPLFGRRTPAVVWIAAGIALAGLYFLCMQPGGFTLTLGDSLVIACAISFTAHILVIDRFAPFVDCIRMSCIQFFTGSVLGSILMMIFEPPTPQALVAALPAILFAGVMSNGIAYTLQVVAQKGVPPALASLIMSLESVFGVLGGWLIMGQTMSGREVLGCALMFAAIVLAQIPLATVKRLLRRKTVAN